MRHSSTGSGLVERMNADRRRIMTITPLNKFDDRNNISFGCKSRIVRWISRDEETRCDHSKADAQRMGRSALIGVLAHELCHAEEDLQQDPIRDALLLMACDLVPGLATSLETASERRIDAAVVRKGYGRQLLAFQKYHDRHYEPYEPTDGLTVEEIEAALRAASV